MSAIKKYINENIEVLKKLEGLSNIAFLFGLIIQETILDKNSILLILGAIFSSIISFLLSHNIIQINNEERKIEEKQKEGNPSKSKINTFVRLIGNWSISLAFIACLSVIPSCFIPFQALVVSSFSLIIVFLCLSFVTKNKENNLFYYLKHIILLGILANITFNDNYLQESKKKRNDLEKVRLKELEYLKRKQIEE